MRNHCKQETGLITVEAIISLTTFMFAMYTVLSIVNICVVQAKIATAINATAKELSQYSYLYSLTGFNQSTAELHNASEEQRQEMDSVLNNVNTVFGEIQNLGPVQIDSDDPVGSITEEWDRVAGSVENMTTAGGEVKNTIAEMAKDPKKLIFGIAKMMASEGLELAKSRLIAEPLSSVLCRKHLVDSDGGDVNAYLKKLGVVPKNGSYIDGLDFSQSSLFPYGSNEITVSVSYDVKVLALLPLDFSFHFHQEAITHGWLAGEETYRTTEDVITIQNSSVWIDSTANERSKYIRKLVTADMEDEGYQKVSKFQDNGSASDVQLYNKDLNQFVMISTMNPLWTKEGETAMTVDDLNDAVLKESIEQLCGKIKSTTSGKTKVTTKMEVNGTTQKEESDCTGASNKIILVVPEDEGLKDKIETIISQANTNGVEIEVVASFGKGARETTVKKENTETENPEQGGDGGE